MAEDAGFASSLDRARAWLADYRPGLRARELGVVQSVGDGIAWVAGLPSAAMDELLRFEDGSLGQVFHLSDARLGAVLLHQTDGLTAGTGVALGVRPHSGAGGGP